MDVTVHIDRSMGLSTTVRVPIGGTVGQVKEHLCNDDPTGELRPVDLALRAAAATGGGRPPRRLGDGCAITEDLTELELCGASGADSGEEPPAQQLEEEPAAHQQEVAVEEKADGRGAASGEEPPACQVEDEEQRRGGGGGDADADSDGLDGEPPPPDGPEEQRRGGGGGDADADSDGLDGTPPPPDGPEEGGAAAAAAAPEGDGPGGEHSEEANLPPPEPNGPEQRLFALLDRGGRGEVSQRDVLVALRKQPPIRRLFGLPVSNNEKGGEKLEGRLLAIQDAFESGSGLGELAATFEQLRGANAAAHFGFEGFLARLRKPPLRGRLAAAAALLHREHSTGPEFIPTHTWSEVPEGAGCPGGLEYKMDMSTGRTLARLPPGAPLPKAKAGVGAAKAPAAKPPAASPPSTLKAGEAAANKAQTNGHQTSVAAAPGPEGALAYHSTGSTLFVKRSSDPASGPITKVKCAENSEVHATGRLWTGPSGGVWAELDAARGGREGWALVQGPGFGLEGPALIALPD